jgi:hypothetical protein
VFEGLSADEYSEEERQMRHLFEVVIFEKPERLKGSKSQRLKVAESRLSESL